VLLWRSLDEVPADFGRTAVAIGVFDGVHAGHRAIIERACSAAAKDGVRAVVISFDPHPNAVVRPDQTPLMLTSVDQRAALLEALRVDALLALPFTREPSQLSPKDFVEQVLVSRLHAAHVVVGANFRFGHKASGDVELLRHEGERQGFAVDAVELLGDEEPISSTRIRGLVADGDVAAAAAALGRPHRVQGPVVRGDARGRELGYPTANVDVDASMAIPADGVYAGWLVRADGTRLPAAISVGTNPTFDGTERRVEAFALDVDIDLYDEVVAVEFAERLRGMVRFESVDDLLVQMAQDVGDSRRILTVGEENSAGSTSDLPRA
jgi:riboflavin kinase / FMN adenylyltransferase